MNQPLFWPMLAYALWMSLLAFTLMVTRLKAVLKREVPVQYFKIYQGFNLPEKMAVWGRHYDNQFQLPLLFFITCLTAISLNRVTEITLILAWIFVVSRWAHSFVHLTTNYIPYRLIAFAFGWTAVLLMWIQLAFSAF